jgi:hypothetical protein
MMGIRIGSAMSAMANTGIAGLEQTSTKLTLCKTVEVELASSEVTI